MQGRRKVIHRAVSLLKIQPIIQTDFSVSTDLLGLPSHVYAGSVTMLSLFKTYA